MCAASSSSKAPPPLSFTASSNPPLSHPIHPTVSFTRDPSTSPCHWFFPSSTGAAAGQTPGSSIANHGCRSTMDRSPNGSRVYRLGALILNTKAISKFLENARFACSPSIVKKLQSSPWILINSYSCSTQITFWSLSFYTSALPTFYISKYTPKPF
jgi:hypothetical protein